MAHGANPQLGPLGLGFVGVIDVLAWVCRFNEETPHLGPFLGIMGRVCLLTAGLGFGVMRFRRDLRVLWCAVATIESAISISCLGTWMLFHITIC